MGNQPGCTGFKYPPKPPLKGWKLISGMANLHVWPQGPYPPSLVKIRLLTKKPKEELYSDFGMGVPFLFENKEQMKDLDSKFTSTKDVLSDFFENDKLLAEKILKTLFNLEN